MKKMLFSSLLLLVFSCEPASFEIQDPAVSDLVTLPGARIWKLDQILIDYTISYDGDEPVPSHGFVDFNYYCQRPFNKLSDDYYKQTEGDYYEYEFSHTYSYNDNFKLSHITQNAEGQTDHTDFFYDENSNWTGIEFTLADGSKFQPEIVQNASRQVISYTDESTRTLYTWKRDNLIRMDVYVRASSTAALSNQLPSLAIPLNSPKVRFARHHFDQSHQTSLKQRSGFRSNNQTDEEWIKIETNEFTYFEHLLPDATTASGWPSTTSEWGIATPVNDIKTWTTWEIDENGNKGVKFFELSFSLLKIKGDVPTLESFTQSGSYFDGERIVNYFTTGTQEFTYQSGCKSPLQSSAY